VLSNKEAPGNADQVKANVAAWKALGEAGQVNVKDPMTVLYKGVQLEVSRDFYLCLLLLFVTCSTLWQCLALGASGVLSFCWK
jgi:hypothetical protein